MTPPLGSFESLIATGMDPFDDFGQCDMAITEQDFMEMGLSLYAATTLQKTAATPFPYADFLSETSIHNNMYFTNVELNEQMIPKQQINSALVSFDLYSEQLLTDFNPSPQSLTSNSFSESPIFSEMEFDAGLDNSPYSDSMITGTDTMSTTPMIALEALKNDAVLEPPLFLPENALLPPSSLSTTNQMVASEIVCPRTAEAPVVENVQLLQEYAETVFAQENNCSIVTTATASSALSTSFPGSTIASISLSGSADTRSASAATSKSTSSYKCPLAHCGATFQNKTKLKVHTNKHTKPFRCTVTGCDSAFAEKKSLQRHLLAQAKWCETHRLALQSHGVKEILYACPNAERGCTYTTVRDDNLKRHVSTCSL